MRLLLVEDDPRIAEPTVLALREAGFETVWRKDGKSGLEEARAGRYPLLILDVMLPGMSGFELARQLREENLEGSILFLTARDGLSDRVKGLDIGGDAYLTKPFELPELLATLRALARRNQNARQSKIGFGAGRGIMDTTNRRVFWDETEVTLTAREYALLETLALSSERWYTRDELLERVWGPDFAGEARIVDVYISYLRRKLAAEVISSSRGRGYRLEI